METQGNRADEPSLEWPACQCWGSFAGATDLSFKLVLGEFLEDSHSFRWKAVGIHDLVHIQDVSQHAPAGSEAGIVSRVETKSKRNGKNTSVCKITKIG